MKIKALSKFPFLRQLVLVSILLGAFPFSFSQAFSSPIKIQITYNETLSLFYFVEAVMGRPARSRYLRKIYLEAKTQKHEKAINKIKSAFKALPRNYRFYSQEQQLPKSRHYSQSIITMLEIFASSSKNIDDFSRRITGLIPIPAHDNLIEGLKILAPLHYKLIWRPGKRFLYKAKRKLEVLFKSIHIDKLMRRIEIFYGCDWPRAIPLRIALVPIPGLSSRGARTYGHSQHAFEVVEVLEKDNLKSRIGILVHELCHSIYGAQRLAFQRKFEKWFLDKKNRYAYRAYNEINEALATAIGNGYVNVLTQGDKTLTRRWYNNRVIDGFAKDLYPLVKDYLLHKREIDSSFVNDAIKYFKDRFPHFEEYPEVLLPRIYALTNKLLNHSNLITLFKKELHIRSLYFSRIDNEKAILSIKEKKKHTVLFLFTLDDYEILSKYGVKGDLIKDFSKKLKNGESFVYAIDQNKRPFIFLGFSDAKNIGVVIKRFGQLKRIKKGKFIQLNN